MGRNLQEIYRSTISLDLQEYGGDNLLSRRRRSVPGKQANGLAFQDSIGIPMLSGKNSIQSLVELSRFAAV